MDRLVTAIVLSGGRGSRMGGVDKGLQYFRNEPLAAHALHRLQQQQGEHLAACMINANRNLQDYTRFGVPVWSDDVDSEFAGPLAGFIAGLEHCTTPWLLTVPCDSPLFPLDLLQRLMEAVNQGGFDMAIASAPESPGAPPRMQPVFCLMHRTVLPGLRDFVQNGGRKIDLWTATLRCTVVPFDRPGDDAGAFSNVNTVSELKALEN